MSVHLHAMAIYFGASRRWHTMKGTQTTTHKITFHIDWLIIAPTCAYRTFAQKFTCPPHTMHTITMRINDFKLHSEVCNWSQEMCVRTWNQPAKRIPSHFNPFVFHMYSETRRKKNRTTKWKETTKKLIIDVFDTMRIHQMILLRGYESHTNIHLDRLRVNWQQKKTTQRLFAWLQKQNKTQKTRSRNDWANSLLNDSELTIIYLLYEPMSSSLIL